MSGFFNIREVTSEVIGKQLSCAACGLWRTSKMVRMKPRGKFGKKIMNVFSDNSAILPTSNALLGCGIKLDDDCLNVVAIACDGEPESKSKTVRCCRKYVLAAIQENKPEKIILHGETACSSVLGSRWKKEFPGIETWRGYCIPDQHFRSKIYPVYSAAYVKASSCPERSTLYENDLVAITDDKTPFVDWQTRAENAVEIAPYGKVKSFIKDIIAKNLFSAFDFETTGKKPHDEGHYIFCCSISTAERSVAFRVVGDSAMEEILRLYLESDAPKAAHNMKFEYSWALIRLKITPRNIVWDSMVAAHIIDSRAGTTGLKWQTYVQFGVAGYDDAISKYIKSKEKGGNAFNQINDILGRIPIEDEIMKYCGFDSFYTVHLALKQMEVIGYELDN